MLNFGLGSQIYKGDHRPRILPCVMASSAMRLKLGVFGFWLTTHAKRNAKQMRPRSWPTVRCFTHVYLHTQTTVDAGDKYLTNHGYFDYGKNPKTPKLSPMLGWKWHRFWDLPCISVFVIQFHHNKRLINRTLNVFLTWFLHQVPSRIWHHHQRQKTMLKPTQTTNRATSWNHEGAYATQNHQIVQATQLNNLERPHQMLNLVKWLLLWMPQAIMGICRVWVTQGIMGRVQGIMGSIRIVQHLVGTLVQRRWRYQWLAVQMTRGKANGI